MAEETIESPALGEAEAQLSKLGYKQELHRTLGLWDLVIYGLVFMVPIAPFAT